MTNDTPQDRFLSRQEAAALLRTDTATVDRLIGTGLLPRYRLGGRWVRVRERDVRQLLDVPLAWLERC